MRHADWDRDQVAWSGVDVLPGRVEADFALLWTDRSAFRCYLWTTIAYCHIEALVVHLMKVENWTIASRWDGALNDA